MDNHKAESLFPTATIPAPKIVAEVLSLSQDGADALLEPDVDSLLCVSQESTEIPLDPAPQYVRRSSKSPVTVTVSSPSTKEQEKLALEGNGSYGPMIQARLDVATLSRATSSPGLKLIGLPVQTPQIYEYIGDESWVKNIMRSQDIPQAEASQMTVDGIRDPVYLEFLESGIYAGPITESLSTDRIPFDESSLGFNKFGDLNQMPSSSTTVRGKCLEPDGQALGHGHRLLNSKGELKENQLKFNDELAIPKRQNRPRMHYHDRDHRLEVAFEERRRFERERHLEAEKRARKVSMHLHELAHTNSSHHLVTVSGGVGTVAAKEEELSDLANQMRRFRKLREQLNNKDSEDQDISVINKELQRLSRLRNIEREEKLVTKELAAKLEVGWIRDAREAVWQQDNDSKVHDGFSQAYAGGIEETNENIAPVDPSQSEAISDDPFNPLYHSSAETFACSLATTSDIKGAKTAPDTMILPSTLSDKISLPEQSVGSSKQQERAVLTHNDMLKDSVELGAVVPSHTCTLNIPRPAEGLQQSSTISLLDIMGRRTNKKGSTKLRVLPQFHGHKLGEKVMGVLARLGVN